MWLDITYLSSFGYSVMDILLSPIQFFFLFTICFYLVYKFKPSNPRPISNKFLKTYPLLGHLPEFFIHRHQFLDWTTHLLANSPANTLTIRRPGDNGIITANPANVEYTLKTNFPNYPNGDYVLSLLGDFIGHGIFNSDGDLWKEQRTIAGVEFSKRSLRTFVMEHTSLELKTRFIPLLSKASEVNKIIDLQNLLERFTFDIVCMLSFGEDTACLGGDGNAGSEFMAAFIDATVLTVGRFFYLLPGLWRLKRYFNIGSEKRIKVSLKLVHEFVENVIKSRVQEKDIQKEDLLSRFIVANSENSIEYLRDVVMSFIIAGRETTPSALSWFFWILSSKPDVENKILQELKMIRIGGRKNIGDLYDLDELHQMQYLHAAISESMRLYPPVPFDTKACDKDDFMPDGTFIRKGWSTSYHTYAMGRMENIWGKDCNEFVPERWLDNGTFRPENPYKYPIFHGGPRMCLGKDIAYIQMKSIAASVIERFEIEAVNGRMCPQYDLSLSLRMQDGLMVRVKERSTG